MKFHHLGIPTKNKLKDEEHLKDLKLYVSGFDGAPIEFLQIDRSIAGDDV